MTIGVAVVQKNGKYLVEFRFHDKDKTVVANSSEQTTDRGEAESLAHSWSKSYGAKIEV